MVDISAAIFIFLDDPISSREAISRCIDLENVKAKEHPDFLESHERRKGRTFCHFPYRQGAVCSLSGTFQRSNLFNLGLG